MDRKYSITEPLIGLNAPVRRVIMQWYGFILTPGIQSTIEDCNLCTMAAGDPFNPVPCPEHEIILDHYVRGLTR